MTPRSTAKSKHSQAKRSAATAPEQHVLSQLQVDNRNANAGTPRGKRAILHSLQAYGYGRSILVDRNNRVIAGNKTLENAKALGATEVLVVPSNGEQLVAVQRIDLDLDHSTAQALAVADNRCSELGLYWDRERLKELAAEADLSELFDSNELEKLIGQEAVSAALDDSGSALLERAVELANKWATKRDQCWEIPCLRAAGKAHRLLCADCTDLAAVGKVMAGQRANMTFTDPPWNVNINGGNHGNRKRKGPRIANDSLPAEQFHEFLRKAVTAIRVAAGGDFYCVMASAHWPDIDRILRHDGYHWSATIVWAKQAMVLTRRHYHSRFEPIWYGWHQHSKSSFSAGRDQDDLWEFPRPLKSPEHPTMKPVEMVARAVFNSSRPGDLVFEPFSGAGTTLLAAEKMGRVCYAMEILPEYVAVALERLSACGLQPRLIEE